MDASLLADFVAAAILCVFVFVIIGLIANASNDRALIGMNDYYTLAMIFGGVAAVLGGYLKYRRRS
jgi:nitrate reductase gamma subunit